MTDQVPNTILDQYKKSVRNPLIRERDEVDVIGMDTTIPSRNDRNRTMIAKGLCSDKLQNKLGKVENLQSDACFATLTLRSELANRYI